MATARSWCTTCCWRRAPVPGGWNTTAPRPWPWWRRWARWRCGGCRVTAMATRTACRSRRWTASKVFCLAMAHIPGVAAPLRPDVASWSGRDAFDQAHFLARHQPVDVDQDQHAIVDGAQADDMFGIDGRAHVRRGLDLLRQQRRHVRHGVDHHADDAVADIEDDDDRERTVFRRTQREADAHVHDGHDDAAQVQHALDEIRRIGDAGRAFVVADLADLLDIDAVFFLAQGEGEVFGGHGAVFSSGHGLP